MTRKLLLAGEGPDELGVWFRERPYRAVTRGEAEARGVLEALIAGLELGPWEVIEGVAWKERRIPLYRAGERRAPETRRVLGLALLGEECGADVVVFARDRDRDEDREADIEAGIAQAAALGLDTPIAGGVAVEESEAWLLALLGDRAAESHARPKEMLAETHGIRSRAQKVAVIEHADWRQVPPHAPSLVRFCSRVCAAIGRASKEIAG